MSNKYDVQMRRYQEDEILQRSDLKEHCMQRADCYDCIYNGFVECIIYHNGVYLLPEDYPDDIGSDDVLACAVEPPTNGAVLNMSMSEFMQLFDDEWPPPNRLAIADYVPRPTTMQVALATYVPQISHDADAIARMQPGAAALPTPDMSHVCTSPTAQSLYDAISCDISDDVGHMYLRGGHHD